MPSQIVRYRETFAVRIGDGLALASSEPSLHVMTMPAPRALTEITYRLSAACADRDAGLNAIAGNGAVVFTPMERTMSE